MWHQPPPIEELEKALDDPTNPIGMRMRAAYYLRQVHSAKTDTDNDSDDNHNNDNKNANREVIREACVNALAKGLLDVRHGSLMRHEFAYVMGQLRDEQCCETLEQVLRDEKDCVMVRHEAAEALGAIGAERSEQVLKEVRQATCGFLPELSDTCQLAINVMEWRANGGDPDDMPAACACMLNPYSTVDPAPPHPAHQGMSFQSLGDILCNAELPIFERYRAMFSLRNRGGADAVEQLARALTQDTSSPLLRHEVAYVLGQMQHPASVEALGESLRRTDEHMMVRHESAEALGAIDGRWEDVERILKSFVNDENDVVRESCLVALDAADYWGHSRAKDEDSDNPSDEDNRQHSFSYGKAESAVLANHFNVAT